MISTDKVKDNNYYMVQGWMVSELHLKGIELSAFAIIYSFCQYGEAFKASIGYLEEWTNSSNKGVRNALNSLVEKGYLLKEEKYLNNVKFCEYSIPGIYYGERKFLPEGYGKNYQKGEVKSAANNYIQVSITTYDKYIKEFAAKTSEPERIESLLYSWIECRKVKKAPNTERAIQLNLNKLEETARESGMDIATYLEEVITRGWQAFYVINNNRKGGNNGANTDNSSSYSFEVD